MKNLVLNSITYLMGIIFIVTGFSFNNGVETYTLIMFIISGVWLWLVAWAKGYIYK